MVSVAAVTCTNRAQTSGLVANFGHYPGASSSELGLVVVDVPLLSLASVMPASRLAGQ